MNEVLQVISPAAWAAIAMFGTLSVASIIAIKKVGGSFNPTRMFKKPPGKKVP